MITTYHCRPARAPCPECYTIWDRDLERMGATATHNTGPDVRVPDVWANHHKYHRFTLQSYGL
jgi:hypothetical protein